MIKLASIYFSKLVEFALSCRKAEKNLLCFDIGSCFDSF